MAAFGRGTGVENLCNRWMVHDRQRLPLEIEALERGL